MKKYLVFMVIAVLFTALPTQAQFKWGLKAGLNLADVSFSKDDIKTDNYTGFLVGPMMEFTVPIIGVGLDAALLYSQTGFKTSGVAGVIDGETIKSGSIQIPVNFKYKLSLMDIVGAYAAVGPYVDFKVYDSLGAFKDDLEKKSFGAGLNFGLGVELLSKLQVGANYQLGLTDDYGATSATQMLLGKGKNHVWSITAAYFF